MPPTTNDFNPDQFLAQTAPPAGTFNPDAFLAQTSGGPMASAPAAPQQDSGLWDEIKNQAGNIQKGATGLWNLAGQAGQGIVNAVSHPIDTVHEIANSIGNTTGQDVEQGLNRAIRATPLVGPAYEKLTGMSPQQIQDANKADAQHQMEHPLTDFIQKSAPMMLMPGGVGKQVAILAADTFARSKAEGKNYADATHDAINTAILAGTFLKGVPMAAGAGGKALAKEFGVSGDAIDRYMANPEAVNAAAENVGNPEALKDSIDQAVAPVNQAVTDAQGAVDTAQQGVQASKAANVDLAQQIPASLDTQGAKLKAMSDQAFDILSNEGQTFPVADLQQAVTDQMDKMNLGGVGDQGVAPTMGPDAAAIGAMGQFNQLLGKVQEKFGDDVPAPVVKELIQQLDDISKDSYSTNAGALSPVAAGKLAQIRHGFNQLLRNASPAYAEAMDNLSPQVGLVNDMSKVFGNEQKAMGALQAAANPSSPQGYTVRQMLQKYDVANGTNFLEQVQDYYDKPKTALSSAQDALSQAQNAAQGVSKLGPNSTEGVVKAIQGGRNIEATRQLQDLNPDVLQNIQDTGVAAQFQRPTTNGSRKTVVGGLIGGAAGHLVGTAAGAPELGKYIGGAVGGGFGFLADKYGGQAVKTALDGGIALQKLVNTPYIGPLMSAAAKGPAQLAITHYMLNQTSPEYQQMMNGGQNP